MSRWHSSLCWCAMLLMSLTGCRFEPVDPAADYAQRLANVLDADLSKTQLRFPQFPDTKQLAIEEVQSSISIREFLGLRQCKLHLVIAERNSLIGKVSSSSQRLKNDLQILQHGPSCLSKIDNAQLAEKLRGYLQIKRQQLPRRVWHAVLAQDEYRLFWKRHTHNPEYPSRLTSGSVIDDLKLITDFVDAVLKQNHYAGFKDFANIEQALGRIRHADAGQLLSELHLLKTSLSTADNVIDARLERKLCLQPNPTTAAKYTQNVVTRYFAESVQEWAIQLHRRHQQIMPIIEKLEGQLLPYSTEEFKRWIRARNQFFEDAQSATLEHATRLQKLYAQCGLRAGTPLR